MATTVTAYASADSDPVANPNTQLQVDLSAVSLPQTGLQLYGAAADSANPSNTSWAYTWTILDNDAVSPASISSQSAQNPTIDVQVWRNVRLFLVAQNTATGVFSEQNPLKAPDSAFIEVEVLGQNSGLQKIAAGSRNWMLLYHALVAKVESHSGGLAAHTVASHSDTSATGAELNTLTDGSSATGLHTHAGSDTPAATASDRGTVQLEEAGSGGAKVITRERVQLQATVDGSWVGTSWQAGQILPASYETNQTVVGGTPLDIWKADEALKILSWSVQLVDGGSATPTNPYSFQLGVANATQAAGGTWTAIGGALSGSPGTANAPLLLSATLSSEHALAAGEYIALFCLSAPRAVADGDTPGGPMKAQVFARREVG